eukprot:TRINITY_DN698_c0_g1_i1.p1 TRINITY_DN698_c0_g1~~TRINITY_DN698_c0_g1_i1.p1  ORF type:complete len:245 (+),score=66.96 TRINITY_DN698_c0_g1_i1:55-789(+)
MDHQEPISAIPRNITDAPMLKRSFAIDRDEMTSSSGHPVLPSPPVGRRSINNNNMKNSDVLIVDPLQGSSGSNRLEELERTNRRQADKINDLEIALAEARKIIQSRESLLTQLQWQPKDDFYVYKNPKSESSKLETETETKMQALLEQMRIMEKIINERDQDTTELLNQLAESGALAAEQVPQSLATSQHMSDSPVIKSLANNNRTQASSPLWMRSPAASPATSKKSWWGFSSKKNSEALVVEN